MPVWPEAPSTPKVIHPSFSWRHGDGCSPRTPVENATWFRAYACPPPLLECSIANGSTRVLEFNHVRGPVMMMVMHNWAGEISDAIRGWRWGRSPHLHRQSLEILRYLHVKERLRRVGLTGEMGITCTCSFSSSDDAKAAKLIRYT